jgi:hypothetical protein
VTVTPYEPDAAGDMVPLISPALLIDRPGGRFDAVKSSDGPAAALSERTCSWMVVPGASCWWPGSSNRTAPSRK